MRRLRALLTLAVVALPALADGLPPSVLAALKAAQIPASSVAVVVQPVDARAPLVAHNGQKTMNPASVMKLVTTYAALDLLGPAWTWKTTALADAVATIETTAGPRVDGVLRGNLYLRGSGDPRFAIEHLSSLLRQLRVRHHDPVARLEVPPEEWAPVLAGRERIVARFRELGYLYVALDLAGFRSGSLNDALRQT